MSKTSLSITLLCGEDQQPVVATSSLINFSNTLKSCLEDAQEGLSEIITLPLASFAPEDIKHVIEWCDHHQHDPPHTEEPFEQYQQPDPTIFDVWDKDWIRSMDKFSIYALMEAANFLEITPLLETCAKAIANMMTNKTYLQLREEFQVETDYTPEEEEHLKNTLKWAQDLS